MTISKPPNSPPSNLNPILINLKPGTELRRIYKDKDNRTERTFNYKGPYGRFDHHRYSLEAPQIDSDRGVSYWGWGKNLSCCLVEVFGDDKVIAFEDRLIRRAALMELNQSVLLLDLRGNGSMRIGSSAKLAKDGARETTQAWSCHFYDNPQVFGEVDGLLYANSHNDENSICFYERVIPKLDNAIVLSIALNDPAIQTEIQQCCADTGMIYY